MKKSGLVLSGMLFVAALAGAGDARADSAFELGSAGAEAGLSVDALLEAPAYRENRAQVHARAREILADAQGLPEEAKIAIAGTLEELPFHRIADVQVAFLSGIPDLVGLCLEGFPTNNLAIEACASTAIFVSSLALNVKYRWDLVLKQNERGRIHNLQLGPGGGIRYMEAICFDACLNGTVRGDLVASLEYTYWLARHFGLQVQFDAGVNFRIAAIDRGYGSTAVPLPVIPFGRIMIGVAF
jgi:hypothetical protein